MSEPVRSVVATTIALLSFGFLFRFFPWTRRPWLASLLGLVMLLMIVAAGDRYIYDYYDYGHAHALIGAINGPIDFLAALVLTGLFYEWRDKSGRAHDGYSALARRGRIIFAIAVVACSLGFFVMIALILSDERVALKVARVVYPRTDDGPPGRYSLVSKPGGRDAADGLWMLDTATGVTWHTCRGAKGSDDDLTWCKEVSPEDSILEHIRWVKYKKEHPN
jgi:hypothetical protein